MRVHQVHTIYVINLNSSFHYIHPVGSSLKRVNLKLGHSCLAITFVPNRHAELDGTLPPFERAIMHLEAYWVLGSSASVSPFRLIS